jgi:methionine aminopeptidase
MMTFFNQIKEEAQKRLENKIKMEQKKAEIAKIKENARRMAELAQWKAWRNSAKKEEKEVFQKLKTTSIKDIKNIFKGRAMLIGGERTSKFKDMVNEAGQAQRKIDQIRNQIRAIRSDKFIVSIGEHHSYAGYHYEGDFCDKEKLEKFRNKVKQDLEKELDYYSVKRTNLERKIKQYT